MLEQSPGTFLLNEDHKQGLAAFFLKPSQGRQSRGALLCFSPWMRGIDIGQPLRRQRVYPRSDHVNLMMNRYPPPLFSMTCEDLLGELPIFLISFQGTLFCYFGSMLRYWQGATPSVQHALLMHPGLLINI